MKFYEILQDDDDNYNKNETDTHKRGKNWETGRDVKNEL